MQNLKVGDVVFVGRQEDKKGSAGLFFFVNGLRRNAPAPGTKATRVGPEVPDEEGEWKFRNPSEWENAHLGAAEWLTGGEQFAITETPL